MNLTGDLDDAVHQRIRLGMLALLREVDRADFTFLRDTLELTDGVVHRHLKVLEDAGLIDVEKGYEGRRPRTRVRLSSAGKAALDKEIAALKRIVERVERAAGAEPA
ncbi:winged helix-turn-helix domain-containing protein [Kibdelosporangium phytohabitans]|uniref:MarR family transcriptional regulator n=1 Tax=Kibdelosporangium phytohabitans TaxID=860235 RepID=A0A0N9HJF1_9PSEU|nr:transcriptional regulator [Kibdelosporangium phytohabitans]ALG06165.1 MarR family transcriptional regulator [Kibdelosporangium phytohabitans]MBE1465740.1 DNA-binding MarR family transcriptional regulator [Kibdelosporangium phytohabitans]